jgi:ketosteroid isomerase-like protein
VGERQNVERIGRIYEAFAYRDIGYILDQLRDEVRWVSHFEPVVPWSGDYSGKRNVPRFFAAIDTSVEVTSFVPGEFVAQGRTVVSLGQFSCRVRATGKAALTHWVFVWKFREGLVFSFDQFHDRALVDAFCRPKSLADGGE